MGKRTTSGLLALAILIFIIGSIHSCSERSTGPGDNPSGLAWRAWRNPAPPTSYSYWFLGMWGSSSSDLYVVGQQEMVLHYNGLKWEMLHGDGEALLYDIWGDSARNLYAVGSGGKILHYDGAGWSYMNSGTSRNLNAIWGDSGHNIYAVGDTGTVVKFDGTRWIIIESGTDQTLHDVWGDDQGRIFAVGDNGTILDLQFSAPRLVSLETTSNLHGIGGNSAAGLWAVGELGTILHFDGTAWEGVRSGTLGNFEKVCAASDGHLYAIGGNNRLLDYDGRTWNSSVIPREENDYGDIVGIWAGSSMNVFVALPTSVLRDNGLGWRTMQLLPRGGEGGSSLRSVWGSSGHDVYAAGDICVHYDGASWDTIGQLTYLTCLWGKSANDIYAAGGYGNVLHFNGSAWSVIRTCYAEDCLMPEQPVTNGIWAASESDVFVVGLAFREFCEGNICYYEPISTIEHFNGSSWGVMQGQSQWRSFFMDVWGSSHDNVTAVGTDGAILHYDGTTWSSMESGTGEPLHAIWGTAPDSLLVVGGHGAILRFDGSNWTPMNSKTGEDLADVWGSSMDNVFAVGSNGIILHYDGVKWTTMRSPSNNNLSGVWGGSPDDVFAVGEYGTILHYGER